MNPDTYIFRWILYASEQLCGSHECCNICSTVSIRFIGWTVLCARMRSNNNMINFECRRMPNIPAKKIVIVDETQSTCTLGLSVRVDDGVLQAISRREKCAIFAPATWTWTVVHQFDQIVFIWSFLLAPHTMQCQQQYKYSAKGPIWFISLWVRFGHLASLSSTNVPHFASKSMVLSAGSAYDWHEIYISNDNISTNWGNEIP